MPETTDTLRRTGGGPWTSPYRALTIGLQILVAGAAFERLGVNTAMPAAAAELGGLALYGWVSTAFMLTDVVGLAVAGPLFDRHGLVRPLLAGVAVFSAGLLVATVAPSMLVVVLGRAVQGLGAGLLSVATYTAIGRAYPDTSRPAMLALNASAFTVPSLVGPLVAGLLADHLSWRWVFAVLVPLVPVAALIAKAPLNRVDDHRARTAGDAPGASVTHRALRGLALGAGVALALVAAELGSVAAIVAVLLVGVAVAALGATELLPRGLLVARRGLPANTAFAVTLSFAYFAGDVFVPLGLTQMRGTSSVTAGLVLTVGVLGWTGGAWLPAKLPNAARGRLARGGAGLVAAGLLGSAAVVATDVPVPLAALVWTVAGIGAGVGFTANSNAVLDDAAPTETGRASSQMELGNVLGIALGTGLGGLLIGADGATGTYGMAGSLVLAAGAASTAFVVAGRFVGEAQ